MTDVAEISTLRRKLGATRPASEPEVTSPAGLLRKAVAKAGEDLHGLVAAVTGFGESRAGLGDIMEGLPEPALLMSLVSALLMVILRSVWQGVSSGDDAEEVSETSERDLKMSYIGLANMRAIVLVIQTVLIILMFLYRFNGRSPRRP